MKQGSGEILSQIIKLEGCYLYLPHIHGRTALMLTYYFKRKDLCSSQYWQPARKALQKPIWLHSTKENVTKIILNRGKGIQPIP